MNSKTRTRNLKLELELEKLEHEPPKLELDRTDFLNYSKILELESVKLDSTRTRLLKLESITTTYLVILRAVQILLKFSTLRYFLCSEIKCARHVCIFLAHDYQHWIQTEYENIVIFMFSVQKLSTHIFGDFELNVHTVDVQFRVSSHGISIL